MIILRGLLAMATLLAVAPAAAKPIAADLLIRGGTLYDGSDASAITADIAILGDRIVFVGPANSAEITAKRTINAAGQIIAPGFIDPHTHPAAMVSAADPAARRVAPWLAQGVTTIVTGIDGGGPPDIKAQFERLSRHPTGPNIASYVGFGAVRSAVIGAAARPPTADELAKMRRLVASAMCEGALGLSAGLFYAPQSFAKTDEVIALAREAAQRGGLYDTHQRDESSYGIGLLASVDEAIGIGAAAGLPVHFAHLKALGVDVHGQAPAVIARINAARARGQDVTADQYPWAASGSNLIAALLPDWAQADGLPAIRTRLDDPALADRLRTAIADNLRRRGGPASILLTSSGQPWTGKYLSDLASEWQTDPISAALRIIRSNPEAVSIASFNMIDADIDLLMQQPWMMTGSDGSAGHPRMYATFPEKYARYVVARKVIPLATFIRQSTGRTADTLKIDRRGYLRPGYFADVLVFDPATYGAARRLCAPARTVGWRHHPAGQWRAGHRWRGDGQCPARPAAAAHRRAALPGMMPLPVEEVLPALRSALADNAPVALVAPPGRGQDHRHRPGAARRSLGWRRPRSCCCRRAASPRAPPPNAWPKPAARRSAASSATAPAWTAASSAATRIEVVTEGIFTRMLVADPDLPGIAAVLFDEVHERSLDSDLALALALEAREALRPDLRLLLMSATLDGAAYEALVPGLVRIESQGRMFPVESAPHRPRRRPAHRGQRCRRHPQRAGQRARLDPRLPARRRRNRAHRRTARRPPARRCRSPPPLWCPRRRGPARRDPPRARRPPQGRAGDVDRRNLDHHRRRARHHRFRAGPPATARPRCRPVAAGYRTRQPGRGHPARRPRRPHRARASPSGCGRRVKPPAGRASTRPKSSKATLPGCCSKPRAGG